MNLFFQGGENQMKKVTLGDIVHPSIEYVLFNVLLLFFFFLNGNLI